MTEAEIALQDAIIKRAIELQRMAAGSQKQVEKTLAAMADDLRKLLESKSVSEATKAEIRALLKQADEIIQPAYADVAATVDTNKLAVIVAENTADAMSDALRVAMFAPTEETLASLTRDVLIEGSPASAWWARQAEDTSFKFAAQVRQGVVNGDTTEKIVQRIVGKRGEPGIMDIARRNARALVASSINAAANDARLATYRKNGKHIRGVRWLATLDGHTCPRCAALDGLHWSLDGEPIDGNGILWNGGPPIHMNDRCLLSPVPDRSRIEAAFPGYTADRQSIAKRASSLGQIKNTDFQGYFDRIGRAQQDEQFGKTRAQMMRDGKITVRDLISGDGRELTLEELRGLSAKSGPPKAKAPKDGPPKPKAPFSPISKALTSETVNVEPRLKVQKRLSAGLTESAADPRYSKATYFKNAKTAQFGKASFSAEFTDESVSLIAAIKPELDTMSDVFGIPRLRGIKPISNSHANMGDGILGVNPHQFNSYAAGLGGKPSADRIASLKINRDKMQSEIAKIGAEIDATRSDRRAAILRSPERAELYNKEVALFKRYNATIKTLNKTQKELSAATSVVTSDVSQWKPGDDYSKRPELSTYYFAEADKARSVMYHEFGHHLHQTYQHNMLVSRRDKPPLENEILQAFLNHLPLPGTKLTGPTDFYTRQASNYAATNSKEWFAENFSFYMMGRADLADPDAVAIIKRLLNEK